MAIVPINQLKGYFNAVGKKPTPSQYIDLIDTLNSSGGGSITQGTTPISSGIDQGVLFQSGGVVKQSTVFKFDEATGRFNLNNVASPTAQINAKATDNLSSSNFIVLRDPTDVFNRFTFKNSGDIDIRAAGGTALTKYQNSGSTVKIEIGVATGEGMLELKGQFMSYTSSDVRVASAGVFGKGKFWIGGLSNTTSLPNESSTNVLFISPGTPPALNFTGVQQYAGGTSAQYYPAFRLSDGKVVKLEPQNSTSISTLTDLVNALKNTGILY